MPTGKRDRSEKVKKKIPLTASELIASEPNNGQISKGIKKKKSWSCLRQQQEHLMRSKLS